MKTFFPQRNNQSKCEVCENSMNVVVHDVPKHVFSTEYSLIATGKKLIGMLCCVYQLPVSFLGKRNIRLIRHM